MILEPEYTEYLIIMHEMTHKNLSQTAKDLANFGCTFCSLFAFTNSGVSEALLFEPTLPRFHVHFFLDIRNT